MLDEIGTRGVPWEHAEVAWATNRPLSERPPLPSVGERVWYRRHEWNRDAQGREVLPELAEVVEVQPVNDTSLVDHDPDIGRTRDPNLWHLVRDAQGKPLRDAGQVRYAPVADPWPLVTLRRANGLIEQTREARLRGSAGWLPADYLRRPERWRVPSLTRLTLRPGLPPLNVPIIGGGDSS